MSTLLENQGLIISWI